MLLSRLPNDAFFDEHIDPARPCFSHVCYPSEESPYYQRVLRFLSDRCCKHDDDYIVHGTELTMQVDECTAMAIVCSDPLPGDALMMPIVTEVKTCCRYNDHLMYPGDNFQDFETCSQVTCDENYSYKQIHYDGCCNLNGQMIEESTMSEDGNYICFGGNAYHVTQQLRSFAANDPFPSIFVETQEDLRSLSKVVRALAQDEKEDMKPCLQSDSFHNCIGILRKRRSILEE